MTADLSPGLILILGAVLVPVLPRVWRGWWMLALPVIAFVHLQGLPMGSYGLFTLGGLELTTMRVDKLSVVFAYVFLIAAAIAAIYALHDRDPVQQVAGLVYAGSATGALFAGDLVTLFFYWEGTAIASVFLIWASRTEGSYRAGMRYLIVQVGSGVILLAGIMLHYRATGSIAFGALGLDGSAGNLLIFLAFGIKCAFPLLHNWLEDAYPEATVTGTVILSVFTTKMAIYALARGYAGTDVLVPIGATMALFPLVYSAIENDLRRVLAYALNNQLGFMVVGIGIGTELALNGTVAHAFASVLYKALFFMCMGAVLYRVGTVKASELGGLVKSMPWTTGFCLVGAASISAFPLFSGFISKSMVISAALDGGYDWTFMVLLFASAVVFLLYGIRIPFTAFFGTDSGKRCAEAPRSMLVAMGITAALCVGLGVYPAALYGLLPYATDYAPYTLEHVVTQLQVLAFAGLAFVVVMKAGIAPTELPSINLDTDWFYRRAGWRALVGLQAIADHVWARIVGGVREGMRIGESILERHHGPEGIFGRSLPTGSMAFWTTIMLGAYLVLSYTS